MEGDEEECKLDLKYLGQRLEQLLNARNEFKRSCSLASPSKNRSTLQGGPSPQSTGSKSLQHAHWCGESNRAAEGKQHALESTTPLIALDVGWKASATELQVVGAVPERLPPLDGAMLTGPTRTCHSCGYNKPKITVQFCCNCCSRL
ncbi:hypothetical protein ERJ75_000457300 [Trypanosoma vivax]|uniref:Uncharacterized protein n=1 Tax=Trypanosoma vivax (strain Y486) TaxID=1055687 RepID=G0U502_TRYVY|nr:hypothetical protein ERJ75_000457300 [Trypanosoma vivax]CCC50948.1 hypothetical protein, conserved in T. vivax [Trypanosoma vivax Y486]